MTRDSKSTNKTIQICSIVVLVLACTFASSGQSLDPGAPTPIRSTNLLGKIAARDLGDSRLTDHYYMFKGTPGDLLITVQSRNLNGDLDVFTAVTLRPLLKLSLYAENTKPVTKGIYLRRSEDLILRVEARSPNDDEGSYQLFFGGSFEAIAGGPDNAEPEIATAEPGATTTGGRKTKRVTSVGARIEEPEPPVTEVAATPTPEPTPEVRPEPTPSIKEKPVETETPKTTPPARNARNRRPAARRSTTPTPATPKESSSPSTEEKNKEEAKTVESPPESAEPETKPKSSTRSAPKRSSTTARATPPKPTPEPEPEIGPRLIIETNDGTLINRSMSTVRRVTVESGWVVVTGKDGKVERVALANVVRMSIAP